MLVTAKTKLIGGGLFRKAHKSFGIYPLRLAMGGFFEK